MTIQRYELWIDQLGDAEMMPDECGRFVLAADLPKPAPWLEMPDGPGHWHRSVNGRSHIVKLHYNIYDSGYLSIDLGHASRRVERDGCLWQRIPDAVPPGEGGGA